MTTMFAWKRGTGPRLSLIFFIFTIYTLWLLYKWPSLRFEHRKLWALLGIYL